MKSKVFGLDIGSSSIKAASIRKEGNSFLLDSVAVAPSTPKGLQSESMIDMQALADVIKQMIASANIKATNVALSVPETLVYTKVIQMPELSEQELSAALKFEMEQYIPLPLDQVRTDWEVLGKNDVAGQKSMDVMLVAAPNQVLSKYEKLTGLLSVTPDVIETEIISVHRSLIPLFNTSDASIIVHIGAATTSVAIVKDARIKMVFSLPVGGAAITRAVSVDLGIDMTQAENYKRAYGLNKEAFEGKIGKSLTPVLESIASDIKKSILLFKEKNNNEAIKQIVLSGGSALLPGINVFFTNVLGAQVTLGNCFAAYNIGNVPDQVQAEAPSYNVVIGLALRELL